MYTVMKWCCGMPLGTGVGLGRMELAVAHTEFRAQGIRGTWPDLCCVLVPHENAAKKRNKQIGYHARPRRASATAPLA